MDGDTLGWVLGIGASVVATGALLGALAARRGLSRGGYEQLRDRLGMRGQIEWGAGECVLSLEGTVDGMPARVDFLDGDESADSWSLRVDSARPIGWLRAVPRRRDGSIDLPNETGESIGVPSFDRAFALVRGPQTDVRLSERGKQALAALVAVPRLSAFEWSSRTLSATFSTQTLPPGDIEAALRAMAALARDGG